MRVDDLYQILPQVDVFIGIGTSALVYPDANLLRFFAGVKEKYFIDPHPNFDALPDFNIIQGAATEEMPKLVELLRAKKS